MVRLLTLLTLFFISWQLSAQERCGSTFLKSHQQDPAKFERWLKVIQKQNSIHRQENEKPYVIPVVVHIIHNGEAIGQGSNITEEKVKEQIDILNADFRRTNADAVNTTADFLDVASDTEISFVLAKRDPEGLPTNGITRTRGNQTSYEIGEDEKLKANIRWSPEDYFNIYVAELEGFLGWAQFPVGNLDGLDGEFDPNAETDGVVMDHKYWGINTNTGGSFDSYGRTATHEVGHFLGLRHIWGDGGCSFDDFCEDTPQSGRSTAGCPDEKISCESKDMTENYMDFTDDFCMNAFTKCQSSRMQLILENSPRRRSLLNSKAAIEPENYLVDLGIKDFSFTNNGTGCSNQIFPRVTLRNYGSQEVTDYILEFFENDQLIESVSRSNNLGQLDLSTYSFNPYTITNNGNQVYKISIKSINGTNDENPENNAVIFNVLNLSPVDLPYEEDFEDFSSSNWYINAESAWEINTAALENITNQAVTLPYFDAPENTLGNLDYLISPVLNLTDPNVNAVSFDYAFAQNKGEFTDGLIVAVSTDCGVTFPRNNYLFERYGAALETSPTLFQEFMPISKKDWKRISLDISRFSGSEIRIAFIGQNGNGNNLYLDNFSIGSSGNLDNDASILEVSNFSVSVCESILDPVIRISNDGTNVINSLEVEISGNNSVIGVLPINGLNIRSGSTGFVELPIDLSQNNLTSVSFGIRSVNGSLDTNDEGNSFTSNVLIEKTVATLPIREDFESNSSFNEISDTGEDDWEFFEEDQNRSIYSNNFSQTILGKENWLISPVISVGNLEEGSLTFNLAYAQRNKVVDGLRVLVSTNCDINWSEIIYNKRGELLSTVSENVTAEWFPEMETDWRTEIIDLTEILEESSVREIRIAFVTTNGNGNNIFLDRIQLFETAIPNLIDNEEKMTIFPNPTLNSFFVALNLPVKEPFELGIFDISGKRIQTYQIENGLNQRFEVNIPGLLGVYFVNAKGRNTNITKRVLIGR